jgi:Ca2+-binding EF-hand superfamily protein
MDLFNFIAGGYMSCIGVLMIFVGQRTAYKLKNMRRSLYSQQELQAKFAQSDVDGDGGLDLEQFRMLTNYLGLDMTRRETEAAFNHINTVGEKLTYDDFYSWWTKTDMEENIDERGFVSV